MAIHDCVSFFILLSCLVIINNFYIPVIHALFFFFSLPPNPSSSQFMHACMHVCMLAVCFGIVLSGVAF